MSSILDQEIEWTCPYCNYKNKDSVFDIENRAMVCFKCIASSEVHLEAEISVEDIVGIEDKIIKRPYFEGDI